MTSPLLRFGRSSHTGVSLVEALVAMAVMAFGMLALVGVQATLRFNADVARQRSEASRLAAQDIEQLRSFTAVDAASAGGGTNWDAIADHTEDLAIVIANTTYHLQRDTAAPAGSAHKVLSVTVTWDDRQGNTQKIVMRDVVAGASPVLGALVSAMPVAQAGHRRSGRDPTIPARAHDYDGDHSAFKPSEGGTIAWVFDNLTGVISKVCTVSVTLTSGTITAADLGSCTATTAQLLAGEVRFNLRGAPNYLGPVDGRSILKPEAGGTRAWVINAGAQIVGNCPVSSGSTSATLTAADVASGCTSAAEPISPFATTDATLTLTASDSESPFWPALRLGMNLSLSSTGHSGSPTCISNGPASSVDGQAMRSVEYFCIVYPNATNDWSGTSTVVPASFSDSTGSAWTIAVGLGAYKVCRYTTASTDSTTNTDHPRTYATVKGNVVNQNFLVISGNKSCPTDVAASPTTGDLVNSNTLQHQP